MFSAITLGLFTIAAVDLLYSAWLRISLSKVGIIVSEMTARQRFISFVIVPLVPFVLLALAVSDPTATLKSFWNVSGLVIGGGWLTIAIILQIVAHVAMLKRIEEDRQRQWKIATHQEERIKEHRPDTELGKS